MANPQTLLDVNNSLLNGNQTAPPPVVRFTTPQLTAIDQPIAATFSKAVELLIHQATSPSEQPYLVPGSLVERASTAPPKA